MDRRMVSKTILNLEWEPQGQCSLHWKEMRPPLCGSHCVFNDINGLRTQ